MNNRKHLSRLAIGIIIGVIFNVFLFFPSPTFWTWEGLGERLVSTVILIIFLGASELGYLVSEDKL